EMELHVLPRGHVSAPKTKAVRDQRKLIQLPGRKNAAGNLRPHHVYARLPLAVNSPAKTKCPKLIVSQPSRHVVFRLLPEQFDVRPHDAVVLFCGLLQMRGGGKTQARSPV